MMDQESELVMAKRRPSLVQEQQDPIFEQLTERLGLPKNALDEETQQEVNKLVGEAHLRREEAQELSDEELQHALETISSDMVKCRDKMRKVVLEMDVEFMRAELDKRARDGEVASPGKASPTGGFRSKPVMWLEGNNDVPLDWALCHYSGSGKWQENVITVYDDQLLFYDVGIVKQKMSLQGASVSLLSASSGALKTLHKQYPGRAFHGLELRVPTLNNSKFLLATQSVQERDSWIKGLEAVANRTQDLSEYVEDMPWLSSVMEGFVFKRSASAGALFGISPKWKRRYCRIVFLPQHNEWILAYHSATKSRSGYSLRDIGEIKIVDPKDAPLPPGLARRKFPLQMLQVFSSKTTRSVDFFAVHEAEKWVQVIKDARNDEDSASAFGTGEKQEANHDNGKEEEEEEEDDYLDEDFESEDDASAKQHHGEEEEERGIEIEEDAESEHGPDLGIPPPPPPPPSVPPPPLAMPPPVPVLVEETVKVQEQSSNEARKRAFRERLNKNKRPEDLEDKKKEESLEPVLLPVIKSESVQDPSTITSDVAERKRLFKEKRAKEAQRKKEKEAIPIVLPVLVRTVDTTVVSKPDDDDKELKKKQFKEEQRQQEMKQEAAFGTKQAQEKKQVEEENTSSSRRKPPPIPADEASPTLDDGDDTVWKTLDCISVQVHELKNTDVNIFNSATQLVADLSQMMVSVHAKNLFSNDSDLYQQSVSLCLEGCELLERLVSEPVKESLFRILEIAESVSGKKLGNVHGTRVVDSICNLAKTCTNSILSEIKDMNVDEDDFESCKAGSERRSSFGSRGYQTDEFSDCEEGDNDDEEGVEAEVVAGEDERGSNVPSISSIIAASRQQKYIIEKLSEQIAMETMQRMENEKKLHEPPPPIVVEPQHNPIPPSEERTPKARPRRLSGKFSSLNSQDWVEKLAHVRQQVKTPENASRGRRDSAKSTPHEEGANTQNKSSSSSTTTASPAPVANVENEEADEEQQHEEEHKHVNLEEEVSPPARRGSMESTKSRTASIGGKVRDRRISIESVRSKASSIIQETADRLIIDLADEGLIKMEANEENAQRARKSSLYKREFKEKRWTKYYGEVDLNSNVVMFQKTLKEKNPVPVSLSGSATVEQLGRIPNQVLGSEFAGKTLYELAFTSAEGRWISLAFESEKGMTDWFEKLSCVCKVKTRETTSTHTKPAEVVPPSRSAASLNKNVAKGLRRLAAGRLKKEVPSSVKKIEKPLPTVHPAIATTVVLQPDIRVEDDRESVKSYGDTTGSTVSDWRSSLQNRFSAFQNQSSETEAWESPRSLLGGVSVLSSPSNTLIRHDKKNETETKVMDILTKCNENDSLLKPLLAGVEWHMVVSSTRSLEPVWIQLDQTLQFLQYSFFDDRKECFDVQHHKKIDLSRVVGYVRGAPSATLISAAVGATHHTTSSSFINNTRLEMPRTDRSISRTDSLIAQDTFKCSITLQLTFNDKLELLAPDPPACTHLVQVLRQLCPLKS